MASLLPVAFMSEMLKLLQVADQWESILQVNASCGLEFQAAAWALEEDIAILKENGFKYVHLLP